jgi:hypothetical protein
MDMSIISCAERYWKENKVFYKLRHIFEILSTARHAVCDSKKSLIKCFSTQFHYLYILDESNCNPKLLDINSDIFVEEDSESEILYPIQIDSI